MRMLVRPGLARLALFAFMAPEARVGTAGAAQKLGPVTDVNAMEATLNAAPISWQRVTKIDISGARRATCRPAGLAFSAADPRASAISTNPQKIRSR